MCVAVPARIVEIEGVRAVIDLEGVQREVSVLLCPDAQVGRYALVHAGFAIEIIDEDEARKTLELFRELEDLQDENRPGSATRDS